MSEDAEDFIVWPEPAVTTVRATKGHEYVTDPFWPLPTLEQITTPTDTARAGAPYVAASAFWPVPVPVVPIINAPAQALARIAAMLDLAPDATPDAIADAVHVALHGRAPTVRVASGDDA